MKNLTCAQVEEEEEEEDQYLHSEEEEEELTLFLGVDRETTRSVKHTVYTAEDTVRLECVIIALFFFGVVWFGYFLCT